MNLAAFWSAWAEQHRLEHWLALRGGWVRHAEIIRLTDYPLAAGEAARHQHA